MNQTNSVLKVYTDGSCLHKQKKQCSIGFVIKDDENETIFEHSEKIGKGTSNIAEFTALDRALEKLSYIDLEEDEIKFFSDSELLVNGINKNYNFSNSPHLEKILSNIKKKLRLIEKPYSINYIGRELNSEADRLTKLAA